MDMVKQPLRAQSVFSIAATIVGILAWPAMVLPFVSDVSPLSVMQMIGTSDFLRNLVWIAIPFFLAPAITLAAVVGIWRTRLPRAAERAAWVASLAAAVSTSGWTLWMITTSIHDGELSRNSGQALVIIEWIVFWVVLTSLPWLALWPVIRFRKNAPTSAIAIAAMQASWLGNAVLCLWLWAIPERHYVGAGAYCTLVAAITFTAQLANVIVAGRRSQKSSPVPEPGYRVRLRETR